MAKTSTGVRKPSKVEQAKLAAAAKANLEQGEQHEITAEQREADEKANEQVKHDAMSQFVAQMTPTAPLTTPPASMEAFNNALADLKKQFNVSVDVKVKPAKAEKKMRNGVVRPGDNTLCGKIWATADMISQQIHGICAIAALKEHSDMHGINEHTIKTQYAKWRTYNGVVGRLPKLHAVHQQVGEYDGLTPSYATHRR